MKHGQIADFGLLGSTTGHTDIIELPRLLHDDDSTVSCNDRLALEPLAPDPNRGQRGALEAESFGSMAQNRSGIKGQRKPRRRRRRASALLGPPLALLAIGFERGQPRDAVSMSNSGNPLSLGGSTR